jgi:multiple sugar transport system permease protein
MKNENRSVTIGSVITIIIMLIILVSVLYPFAWLVLSSFKYEADIIKYPPSLFSGSYTFSQYIRVWENIPLLKFFSNTAIFAGGVTIISILFDSMAGYAFARMKFRGKKQLFIAVLITMMVPFQVVMIPLYIEIYKFGLLDTYAGLILPRATSAFGIYLMRSFFVSLPKDLEEAGRIDGFSEYRIYWSIMMPLCKPALLTLAIIHLMNNWNDLLYPLMLTSSTEMRTLSAGLAMFVGQKTIEYGPTLAATTISILPLLIIYIFAQKYFVQGVVMSGLKG